MADKSVRGNAIPDVLTVSRRLVEAHRIRKIRLEEIVVAGRRLFQDGGQRVPLPLTELRQRANVCLRQQKRLERPHRPPWHHHQEILVFADDPGAFRLLRRT